MINKALLELLNDHGPQYIDDFDEVDWDELAHLDQAGLIYVMRDWDLAEGATIVGITISGWSWLKREADDD